MSANLCVESHMRELLEQGFEVAVVKDATAGAKVPEGDGYAEVVVLLAVRGGQLLVLDPGAAGPAEHVD